MEEYFGGLPCDLSVPDNAFIIKIWVKVLRDYLPEIDERYDGIIKKLDDFNTCNLLVWKNKFDKENMDCDDRDCIRKKELNKNHIDKNHMDVYLMNGNIVCVNCKKKFIHKDPIIFIDYSNPEKYGINTKDDLAKSISHELVKIYKSKYTFRKYKDLISPEMLEIPAMPILPAIPTLPTMPAMSAIPTTVTEPPKLLRNRITTYTRRLPPLVRSDYYPMRKRPRYVLSKETKETE